MMTSILLQHVKEEKDIELKSGEAMVAVKDLSFDRDVNTIEKLINEDY